jgi:hypothetical protein
MKRKAYHVTFLTTVVVMAAFLTVIFFAGPNNLLAAKKASVVDRTETHILKMHSLLKITPAQEELWKAVTDVMRENAKTLSELHKARAEKGKAMNAVEDLRSYGEILDAHAEGLKTLLPAFEGLYNSMSDEQKKNADLIFKTGKPGKHGKAKRK